MGKMQEQVLDTMECAAEITLVGLFEDTDFEHFVFAPKWGFDPKIIDEVLSNLGKYTLESLVDGLERTPSFVYNVANDPYAKVTRLQVHVANSYSGLGARHAIVYRLNNDEIRMVIYSYYSNNPDFHLSWHVFFNPSVSKIKYGELNNVLGALVEMFKVHGQRKGKHVKKST